MLDQHDEKHTLRRGRIRHLPSEELRREAAERAVGYDGEHGHSLQDLSVRAVRNI